MKLQPNIVFLMPDQLRWDFVGCYGKNYADTPNIDALAKKGMVYERCLSPSPVCIPARASMLTGHNALSTGVLNNNFWLRPDHNECGMPSFASLLTRAGYHTEAIGKMHFIPWDKSEGFAHRIIAEDKRHIHIRDDYHDYLQDNGLKKYAGPEEPGYTQDRMASISLIPLEHQVDQWVGQRSVDFLDSYQADKPFFLWTAFPGPHDPYNPPQEILDSINNQSMPEAYAETDDSRMFRQDIINAHSSGSAQVDLSDFTPPMKLKIRQHYRALVKIIDQQVGEIVAALDRRNDERETLIVFSSDHGDFLGDFGFLGKVLFYESSMRVPMICAGPNINTGRSSDLVSLTDVFATFTKAAGISCHCQDSIPLPDIGLGNVPREYVLGATDMGYSISTGQWKYSRYRNGANTLHDIYADPGEQVNRAQDQSLIALRNDLDNALATRVLDSVIDGHQDKHYPYMTMSPDHPGHKRGWKRSYPANPWS